MLPEREREREQVAVCFIVSREQAIKSDEWGRWLVQWMQTTQCSSLPFSQYDPPISIDSPSFLKCFLCSLDCVRPTLLMCSCAICLFASRVLLFISFQYCHIWNIQVHFASSCAFGLWCLDAWIIRDAILGWLDEYTFHLSRTLLCPLSPFVVEADWKTSAPWEAPTQSSSATVMGPRGHWRCVNCKRERFEC